MRDLVTVVTPPAAEPVTVDELRSHLLLNDTSSDADLARYLKAARGLFERRTGRAVLPTTFRQHQATLSDATLGVGNVVSVSSWKYRDTSDAEQTLTGWILDNGTLYLPGGNYPSTSSTRRTVSTIDFVAGWPDAASVPAEVKQAILLLAAQYYTEREEGPIPPGFDAICDLWDTGLRRAF